MSSARLWVLSDLHNEFFDVPPALGDLPDADVCVVAGDVSNKGGQRSLDFLAQQVGRWMPVVFVAGNHEFYRGSVVEGLHLMRNAKLPNVHFLEDDVLVLDGVRFLGCTLWTDFELGGGVAWNQHAAENLMNDYKAASLRKHPTWARLRPHHTTQIHHNSRRFLSDALRMEHDGPTVVVTHHAPHPNSVHQRFEGSALNAAFASDMSGLLEMHGPEMWIHGHMHDSSDYVVGRTRVLANPKGYDGENKGYVPDLVVEVEPRRTPRP